MPSKRHNINTNNIIIVIIIIIIIIIIILNRPILFLKTVKKY